MPQPVLDCAPKAMFFCFRASLAPVGRLPTGPRRRCMERASALPAAPEAAGAWHGSPFLIHKMPFLACHIRGLDSRSMCRQAVPARALEACSPSTRLAATRVMLERPRARDQFAASFVLPLTFGPSRCG